MPVDPSTYTTWLPSSPHLERIALSSSDRARSERYGASGAVNAPRRECSISSTPPRAGATPASPTRIASPGRGSARSARATAIRGRELMGRTILEPRSDRLYPPPRHPHSRVLHDGYVMGRSAPIGAEPVRAGRWVCAEVDLDASSHRRRPGRTVAGRSVWRARLVALVERPFRASRLALDHVAPDPLASSATFSAKPSNIREDGEASVSLLVYRGPRLFVGGEANVLMSQAKASNPVERAMAGRARP
jgi:hypothetical protein